MKKIAVLILLTNISINLYSQDCNFLSKYLATYEFEYQPDSLNPKSKKVFEPYLLFFNERQSYFISSYRLNLDTILYNKVSITDMGRLMKLPKASSNKRIFNTTEQKSLSLFDEIIGKLYFIKDTFQLKWTLLNESDTIGELKVKKATTRFRGRNYIAWYCEDLPFPFGPYKFSGLPGFIIQIHDSQNYISYSLTSFKKTEPKNLIIKCEANATAISKKEFETLNDNYLENPIPYMESEGAVFDEESKRNLKIRFAEVRKNNNNPIELTDE
jgi:GLPGLI family protein